MVQVRNQGGDGGKSKAYFTGLEGRRRREEGGRECVGGVCGGSEEQVEQRRSIHVPAITTANMVHNCCL